MKFIGAGTEKIVDDIKQIFPQARIAAFDKDSSASQPDYISQLTNKDDMVDIVIGTQLLFHLLPGADKIKQLYKPTLVAVLNIDNLLFLPEFRSTERTFRTMYQLTGLAADNADMIIQTANDDHYIFEYLNPIDWKKFYTKELSFRKEVKFPPYTRLACVMVNGKIDKTDQTKTEDNIKSETELVRQYIQTQFKDRLADETLIMLGTDETKISKRRYGYLSQQLILKIDTALVEKIVIKLKQYKPVKHNVTIAIDVDPLEINL
jgi:primosomal protein N' (replication factor Y)